MRSKRIIIIAILTIIISSGILVLTKMYEKSYDKKIKEEKTIINEIINKYNQFKKLDEEAINKRTEIYEKLNDFFSYYESIEKNYDSAIKLYKEYEELVEKTDKKSTYLLEKCDGKDYMSSDVTMKCFAFNRNYEQTINGFIYDIELFSLKIDGYNEWIKDDSSKKKLENYKSKKYTKYVDIDNDKIYLGKVTD